ncbi:tetratricopeptide repeat protein [Luteipulveratus mongoliensis]|uniref:Tetratricopeptide repeat protein n=1 Tax=Luteipulveratus mongoliensis TaxID=571913 RepID=A0A0K1JLN3_9MICO|nr:tetratricopeptide repeat protein [Luteipulveratus mongoliensis]AKU17488.1 tetratricopeptide repeat protein [Luteipulveratus mongoliensis]
MTQQPLNAAALRGAVDLSSLANRPAGGGTPAAGSAAAPGPDAPAGSPGSTDGLVVDIDAQGFSALVTASTRYPVVITLWATSQPASRTPVDELARVVRKEAGRVQLGIVDIDKAPEIAQAFQQLGQAAQLPAGTPMTTVAFLQGQPMPLPPFPSEEAAEQLMDELLKVAVQNGITGRVPGDHDAPPEDDAPAEDADSDELPALHQAAYDAIEQGDYDGAITAYEQALADNKDDEDARLGLGQVRLLKRTEGADLQQARAAAASDPTDVEAAKTVADLDVLGGHVEDAFTRLLDLVRATAGDERNAAREHLIGLFDIVGSADPRVKKARTALMSALY